MLITSLIPSTTYTLNQDKCAVILPVGVSIIFMAGALTCRFYQQTRRSSVPGISRTAQEIRSATLSAGVFGLITIMAFLRTISCIEYPQQP